MLVIRNSQTQKLYNFVTRFERERFEVLYLNILKLNFCIDLLVNLCLEGLGECYMFFPPKKQPKSDFFMVAGAHAGFQQSPKKHARPGKEDEDRRHVIFLPTCMSGLCPSAGTPEPGFRLRLDDSSSFYIYIPIPFFYICIFMLKFSLSFHQIKIVRKLTN